MSSNEPFLLLMPSYNQAHYIVDAVRSVLAQDDPNWQLWIVDNSSDRTPEVMRQFSDPRIRFNHIPQRMDPGTCLNWMLERAIGREFSYVHTDNNLHPSYVSGMRAALSDQPLGLAYCDKRVIDKDGRYLEVLRRGAFDLPRLLSVDPLGVPFAATTELARKMGGFSVRDFADDVRFCAAAYGLANYVHVCKPLVDYRVHSESRTEEAGGGEKMNHLFADLMPKVLPLLEQRGIRPIDMMENAIQEGLQDLDLFIEDHWYRRISKIATPWWQGVPCIDVFFFAGLLDVPGFSSKLGRPPRGQFIRDQSGRIRVLPWARRKVRHYLRQHRDELHRLMKRPRSLLPTWACMKLGVKATPQQTIRVMSLDFRTVWVARQLQVLLGWKPLADSGLGELPAWLQWEAAVGHEPALNCASKITLTVSVS